MLQCVLTQLSLTESKKEVARQQILKKLLELQYPKTDILKDTKFLGDDGKNRSASIVVSPPNSVLHLSPLVAIDISVKNNSFNSSWLEKWKNSNIKLIAWFNGEILKIFLLDSNKNKYIEIPPFFPEYNKILFPEEIGKVKLKTDLRPSWNLKEVLIKLHDYLYGNSNIRLPSRLGIELQKLLLLKKYDEQSDNNYYRFCIFRNEFLDTNTENYSEEKYKEKCINVSKRIHQLLNEYNSKFIPLESISLNDESIYSVVFRLESISLLKTPADVLGEALEKFRTHFIKKEGGQFFTNKNVIKLAFKLINFQATKKTKLADISCGTGGFLYHARDLIIQKYQKSKYSLKKINEFVSKSILGIEIDQDLVNICNTSPEFSNLNNQIVFQQDSLKPISLWNPEITERIQYKTQDFMVGNPPFGSKIVIDNREILKNFDLAKTWNNSNNQWEIINKLVPRSLDTLFIEQNINFLIPGKGKMALVVPYQILSGPKEEFVREWIMRNCKIIAIVDLPDETFQPYTGTKGCLLVIQKKHTSTQDWRKDSDYSIFMSCPKKIGHDRRGKPTIKNDVVDTDFPEVEKAFDYFQNNGDPSEISNIAFSISSKEIKEADGIRLNAAYYQPDISGLTKKINAIAEKSDSLEVSPLGDLVKDIFYPNRFRRDYVDYNDDNTVPFLGGSNITQLIPCTEKRILKEHPRYDEVALEEGWILVTRSGTTGLVSTVPKDWSGYAASEHIIRIIPDPDKIHPGFLVAYLRSYIGQKLLNRGVFGSVIETITTNHISSIPILYPTNSSVIDEIGEKIFQSDLYRFKASKSIKEAEDEIENLLT